MAKSIKSISRAIIRRVKEFSVKHPNLAFLHRGIVGFEHAREISAVAAGQRKYWNDTNSASPTYFLLRRDIHRLEKGLIMRPRRPSFAKDYILEVVKLLEKAIAAADCNFAENPEILWAWHVLDRYFNTVDTNSAPISIALEHFKALPRADLETVGHLAPFVRDIFEKPIVTIDKFEDLCKYRRSVRWFLPGQVSRQTIDRAIEAAGQSPSACNRQPFTFIVCNESASARRIASIPMGTRGFSHQVPGLIVVVGRLRAYPNERDRHAIYIDGAMASMSLIFAFESQGVATCAINWPDHEPFESQMRDELSLDEDERVIMLIAYGAPDPSGMVPASIKRPLSQLRSYYNED